MKPGSMMTYLYGLDAKGRLSLAIETYKQLLLFDKHDTSALKSELEPDPGKFQRICGKKLITLF